MGWSSRCLGGLEAQFHGSGHGLPHPPLDPLGCDLSPGSWPWYHSYGGLGMALELKPALAPEAQMPQTAEGDRSPNTVVNYSVKQ